MIEIKLTYSNSNLNTKIGNRYYIKINWNE